MALVDYYQFLMRDACRRTGAESGKEKKIKKLGTRELINYVGLYLIKEDLESISGLNQFRNQLMHDESFDPGRRALREYLDAAPKFQQSLLEAVNAFEKKIEGMSDFQSLIHKIYLP